MDTPSEYADSLRKAQELYVQICSKLRSVFQKALPEIEALHNPKALFSCQLMRIMHDKAAGRLPRKAHRDLAGILQRVEDLEPGLSETRRALEHGEIADRDANLAKIAAISDALTRCCSDLDAMLGGLPAVIPPAKAGSCTTKAAGIIAFCAVGLFLLWARFS